MTISKEDDLRIRLQSGDRLAWKEVLEQHMSPLIGYAGRMMGSPSLAEEVVQESLVQIYQSLHTFEGRCSIKSWLYRAVRNKAIDELRRRKKFVDVQDEHWEEQVFNNKGRWAVPCPDWNSTMERDLNSKKMLGLVRHCMNKLPHAHREVLLMKGVHELSHQEICDALDITKENLRVRLHRARKALRDAVNKEIM